jgi:hypothetical protein
MAYTSARNKQDYNSCSASQQGAYGIDSYVCMRIADDFHMRELCA